MHIKTLYSRGIAAALLLCSTSLIMAQQTISSSFNANKPVLPSSQYTPGQPYTADVWVANNGERYSDQYYNKVIATPPTDAQDRQWFEPDYELTDGEYAWKNATSPFSSDVTYKDHTSYRWVEAEIMADIYLRRTFSLNSIPAGTIFLACGHDDAPAEFYINGELVHTISDGWNNDEYILLTDEQKALIKTDGSENVIAVHVHQNWGGAFADCGLYEADMKLVTSYLPTMENGAWPCAYYTLNYNEDIAVAEAGGYYNLDEDETEWMQGYGPFSSNKDHFYVSHWASQVRPILLRRHFTLTADDIANISAGNLTFVCSYDEYPKAWLNGTLIWQASGYNDNNYASYTFRNNRKALLKEGDNVIAMSLQEGAGSGHIDFGLRLEENYTPTGIQTVSQDGSDTEAFNRVYTIDGTYVGESTEGLRKGIYIVNKKKVVVTNQ